MVFSPPMDYKLFLNFGRQEIFNIKPRNEWPNDDRKRSLLSLQEKEEQVEDLNPPLCQIRRTRRRSVNQYKKNVVYLLVALVVARNAPVYVHQKHFCPENHQ